MRQGGASEAQRAGNENGMRHGGASETQRAGYGNGMRHGGASETQRALCKTVEKERTAWRSLGRSRRRREEHVPLMAVAEMGCAMEEQMIGDPCVRPGRKTRTPRKRRDDTN